MSFCKKCRYTCKLLSMVLCCDAEDPGICHILETCTVTEILKNSAENYEMLIIF